jgi:hypothetical protein
MYAFLEMKTKFGLVNKVLNNREKRREKPNLLGSAGYIHV